jgi:two-component system, LytTR family, response regulator
MIKCIIVDDEPDNLVILKKILAQYCPEITVVGEAASAEEAIPLIRQSQPQLVLLDIEMPGSNAFDMLNQLRPINFEVIFVTAFAGYAAKAFRYSALDYLLKPVDIDDLRQAIQKAVVRSMQKNYNDRLEALLNSTLAENTFSKIAIPTIDGLVFYPVEDVICCLAKGTYTEMELCKNKNLLLTSTLKEVEEILPPGIFCRVHNSYLINLNHMKKYYKGKGGYVEMSNGRTIEVSFRKREEFLSRLKH